MTLTNLVLLASALTTNHQSAITSRTNGAAVLSCVEQVVRTDFTAWAAGKRVIARQTNSALVSQRRWNEVVADISPQEPVQPAQPAKKEDHSSETLENKPAAQSATEQLKPETK